MCSQKDIDMMFQNQKLTKEITELAENDALKPIHCGFRSDECDIIAFNDDKIERRTYKWSSPWNE